MAESIKVKICCSDENLKPAYAHATDAGLDLRSAEEFTLPPGERRLVKTGVRIELPEGQMAMVCSRSGLAIRNGVFVLNAPGIVDSGYRNEIGVILANLSTESTDFKVGDRIAQLVFCSFSHAEVEYVDSIDENTDRGLGGFGSTGK